MNWTGGQLHRHSAQPGGLSKNQRRNFARSRQLIQNRASGVERVSYDGSLAFSFSQRRDTADANQTNASQPLKVSLDPTNELGTLKRRLLQQPDWAAISAARPLEPKFATAREFEQFGKRRKLTDNDRNRQAVEQRNSDLPGWSNHRTNNSRPAQQDSDLSHLKVHIDGQLAYSNSPVNQAPTTHTSSHSMLLDHDESMSPFSPSLPTQHELTQRGRRQVPAGRVSLPPNHKRAPLHLQTPANNRDEGQRKDSSESADNMSLSGIRDSPVNSTHDSACNIRVEPERITFQSSFHPSATDVSPTKPRRFTIDDQFLAEQMQLNATPNSRQRAPYTLSSSDERLSPLPPQTQADIPMEPETSSWFQNPQSLPYSSSPLKTCNAPLKRSAVAVAYTLPLSSSLVDEEKAACPVPMKIFGQSVELEEKTLDF